MAAEDVRAFCRRTRPPTVLLHNIYDFAVALSAADADALEEEVGIEMSKFGRVLDAEAVAGTVKVYFDATESAMRCACFSASSWWRCSSSAANTYARGGPPGSL